MNKNTTISLVIPAYNEEGSIETCIDFAKENSKCKFDEIIVVNNASTDTTKSIALSIDGVCVVDENKKGPTHARQKGFTVATGELIAFVDADTRMPKNWLDYALKEFDENPNLVCLSGPYEYFDLPRFQQILTWIYWRILGIPMYWITGFLVVGGNFVIKKSTLTAMDGFDISIPFFGDDTNIARRAKKFGKVKFSLKLSMATSGRRLRGEGVLHTAWNYMINFLGEAFLHRPLTTEYKDIR